MLNAANYHLSDYKCYHFNHLTDQEQRVYNQILRSWMCWQTSFKIERLYMKDIDRVIHAVILDHPEIFWVSFRYIGYNTFFSKRVNRLRSEYTFSIAQAAAAQEELDHKIRQIVFASRGCQTQIERVRFFFDYLSEMCSYDGAIEEYPGSQTAVGALVEGKSACAGFANAMTMLCREVDIPCVSVVGDVRFDKSKDETISHRWNIVEADGHVFHLDAAMGIITDYSDDTDHATGLCFSMTDKTIKDAGYKIRYPEFKYPVCSWKSGEAWNGIDCTHFDYRTCLEKCLSDVAAGKRETCVRFADRADLEQLRCVLASAEVLNDIKAQLDLPSLYCRYSWLGLLNAMSVKWGYGDAA